MNYCNNFEYYDLKLLLKLYLLNEELRESTESTEYILLKI